MFADLLKQLASSLWIKNGIHGSGISLIIRDLVSPRRILNSSNCIFY